MQARLIHKVHAALERRFPERRLFLRSDTETRFIRLKPETQLLAWTGLSLTVGWTIVATAIVLMDSIGAGNAQAQAQRNQMIYEDRLNAVSVERDLRAAEALAFQDRFASALDQLSVMQSEVLALDNRLRESETGREVLQAALRRAMIDRDLARTEAETLLAAAASAGAAPGMAATDELASTVELLSGALEDTAVERDQSAADAQEALDQVAELDLEMRLLTERNDEIFRQLEEAMLVSVAPLDDMFRAAGMDPENLLDQVRRGYSGLGGPLTPISFSTRGEPPSADMLRANDILGAMDNINLYRIAAEQMPFALPLQVPYRLTSDFGTRWGRLHGGLDMAAPSGTPILAPADGVVTFAGWSGDYGLLVKVQHEFGIETRYAHQSLIRVEVGQRLSRGDRIGDIGNTGRSTGPHLHYEIRVGGEPVNPMTYIRAGTDVF